MTSAHARRLAYWGASIFVLLLGQAAPPMAHAACSHLVTSYSERSLDFNHLDSLILAGSRAPGVTNGVEELSRQSGSKDRWPCTGARCSSRVPVPSSTASQGSGGFDQWGNLSTDLFDQIITPLDKTVFGPAPHAFGRKPSIFHPPPV
jgi:hypothetical protein